MTYAYLYMGKKCTSIIFCHMKCEHVEALGIGQEGALSIISHLDKLSSRKYYQGFKNLINFILCNNVINLNYFLHFLELLDLHNDLPKPFGLGKTLLIYEYFSFFSIILKIFILQVFLIQMLKNTVLVGLGA